MAKWFEAKTCIDGRVKNMRGGLSIQTAVPLADICYKTLLADGVNARLAVEEKIGTPALERIVEANTLLSGLRFEASGLAAAHAIHNGLTTTQPTYRFLHDEKVAFGLFSQSVLESQSRSVIDAVLNFAVDVGLPVILAGISLDQLEEINLQVIADRFTTPEETIHNPTFEVLPDMAWLMPSWAPMRLNVIGKPCIKKLKKFSLKLPTKPSVAVQCRSVGVGRETHASNKLP
ncbi:MAG: hypothetical protein ACPGLY_23885 [Rubripirellula sp.]